MARVDTLKTAKRCIQAIDQACDGHHDRDVKKAKRKERQKGRKIIREELKWCGHPMYDDCQCHREADY